MSEGIHFLNAYNVFDTNSPPSVLLKKKMEEFDTVGPLLSNDDVGKWGNSMALS